MKTTKQRRSTLLPATLGLAVASLGIGGLAHAGCGIPIAAMNTSGPAGFIPAVYHPEDIGQLLRVNYSREPAIVGLWKFEMLAKSTHTHTNPMPDGTLVDFGTAAWHSDGTELMNSGNRLPADGDFCQGVWEQTGLSTFSLNHMALAYTNGEYTGPAVIKERVTVNQHQNQFAGYFTLVQYLATPTAGHEFDETNALVTITGTITATRITP